MGPGVVQEKMADSYFSPELWPRCLPSKWGDEAPAAISLRVMTGIKEDCQGSKRPTLGPASQACSAGK